jgi:hypothetical protein
MATIPPIPADANAWDKARAAFANSALVDTPLASLAQDLDVPPWPVKSPDETPAAYIYLPYSQAVAALAARGLPPTQLGALITLLNDTNAFDQPFADMMEDVQAPVAGAIDADSPLFKNLAKLELREDFPLSLSALSEGTIELCRGENVDTLGGFVAFASRLSQSVIVGGDFRELLNALAQKDEATLARLLPMRPGTPGLHLREALALVARTLAPNVRAGVLGKPSVVPPAVATRIERLITYFASEAAALRQAAASGTPANRLVAGLDDPALEGVIAVLLAPHLPAAAAPVAPPPKRSFFSRLFGRS